MKKRKRKKKLVLALILLFALMSVLAVFFLIGENSEEKKQYQEQIRQEVKEFTDQMVSELDRIDTSGISSSAEKEGNPAQPPEALITEAEKQVVARELAGLEDQRKQEVLKTLAVAYSNVLEQQKQEAFSMAEDLVAQAKTDWAALKNSGKATAAEKGTLISEYLAKSNVMEEQMDASFEALIQKMEAQMKEEGIDPTAIIEQYRAEYKKIKEENKDALISKAMAAVKN